MGMESTDVSTPDTICWSGASASSPAKTSMLCSLAVATSAPTGAGSVVVISGSVVIAFSGSSASLGRLPRAGAGDEGQGEEKGGEGASEHGGGQRHGGQSTGGAAAAGAASPSPSGSSRSSGLSSSSSRCAVSG